MAEACTVEQAVVSFGQSHCPAILETARPGPKFARYSVLTADPIDVFTCESAINVDPIAALHARTQALPPVAASATRTVPFCGGWIGYLGYESGLGIERLIPTTLRDVPIPDARFALYDTAAVFDHVENRWYAVAVDWPCWSGIDRPSTKERIEGIRRQLRQAGGLSTTGSGATGGLPASAGQPVNKGGQAARGTSQVDHTPRVTANMSRRAYLAKVARAKEHIAAGDIYEVNLTTRFSAKTTASPLELYRRLRAADPSSHGALISWDKSAIISASPELFLDLKGDRVVTRPIKGTRPRGGNAREDETLRRALAESEKDAAELNMIVDLLRNDLGRVCAPGSVRVVEAGEIETHPTVFHRVATIEGRLAAGRGWADLLRASFPGGSITGAPKIRAMQIIDELEPTRRSAYCGAIGMIGLDGSVSLSVAIRTMIQVGQSVHLHAGGAIVADSQPNEEYRELLAKARGMFAALGDPGSSQPDIIDAEEEAAGSWAQ